MAGYNDLILLDTPTAYWRLNETSGLVAADSSGNARDLTLAGVLLNQAGLRVDASGSIYFDGTVGSYALRNPFTGFPTTQFSLSFLVKTLSPPTAAIHTIFSYATTAFFNSVLVSNCRRPNVTIRDAGTDTNGAALDNGQPNHGAVTWRNSDGRLQFWLNGILQHSVTGIQTTQVLLSSGAVALAQDQDSVGGGFAVGDAFQGFMQDVALFSTILSDNNITRQANIALLGINNSVLRATNVSQNLVRVYFEKPAQGLGTAGNFVFSGGLTSVSTVVSSDRRFADVTTTGMVSGTTYTLTVGAGVTDDAGNTLSISVVDFVARPSGFVDAASVLSGFELPTVQTTQGGVIGSGVISGTPAIGLFDTVGGVAVNDVITGIRTLTPNFTVPVQYTMRAYRALSPGFVWWTVATNPDFTGSQSPYPPVELTDIVIEQQFCAPP